MMYSNCSSMKPVASKYHAAQWLDMEISKHTTRKTRYKWKFCFNIERLKENIIFLFKQIHAEWLAVCVLINTRSRKKHKQNISISSANTKTLCKLNFISKNLKINSYRTKAHNSITLITFIIYICSICLSHILLRDFLLQVLRLSDRLDMADMFDNSRKKLVYLL